MAIFNINTDTETTEQEILSAPETDSQYFESNIALDQIAKQISGYKWKVDYFNVNNEISDYTGTLDFNIDNLIAEYTLIKDFVLFVETPLENTTFDTVEGSATIKANILPKNGDFFVSKTLDGRLAIFNITGVSYKKYLLNNIYNITYKLYVVVTEDRYIEILNSINDKIINVLYYNPNYLFKETKELLTTDDITISKKLTTHKEKIISLINHNIIIPEHKYLYVFDNNGSYYHDPYMENFLLKVIPRLELNKRFKTISRDMSEQSILDLVLDNNIPANVIKKYFELYGSGSTTSNPFLATLDYLGLSGSIKLTDELDIEFTNTFTENIDIDIDIFPNLTNNEYLFGSNFYNILETKEAEDVSLIEKLVLSAIFNIPIELDELELLLNKLYYAEQYLQYYYLPIAYYLITYYEQSRMQQEI